MAETKSLELEATGMGYKDKQKALDTLKILDGRDINYQYYVVKSFVGRTKRTLQITRNSEKCANLQEALEVFENWLDDYKEHNRGKDNLAYLPIEIVKAFLGLARKYDLRDDDFYKAYKRENGSHKNLRNVKLANEETTWDIERNRRLKEIIGRIKEKYLQWYETDVGEFRGLPTKEHVECILLGYSPDPSKLKKLLTVVEEKFSTENDESDEKSSDSESDDEEPKKKIARLSSDAKKSEKQGSGLSFKDKEKAMQSIKSMDGRDVSYQYHVISGLARKAARVISCTKDEEKIRNMKEAVEVFENWITDYKVNGRSKENFGCLAIDIVRAFKPLESRYEIEDNGFLEAYEEVNGDYKKLRTLRLPGSDSTWDIERNKNLRILVDNIKEKNVPWYETVGELHGLPTEEHTRCIMWAFSFDNAKLKKLLPTLNEKLKS